MSSESESEVDSDISYVPNDADLDSIEESPKKSGEKKTTKKRQSKAASQSSRTKKQKTDRPLVKNQNHNDFFKNVVDLSEKSSGSSVDMAKNPETIGVKDTSAKSMDEKEEESNESMRAEMREVKHIMYGVQRQLARIETLIKFQRESVNSNELGTNYIEDLESIGLPITSKEQMEQIEKELETTKFKDKLVRCNIHSIQIKYNNLNFKL